MSKQGIKNFFARIKPSKRKLIQLYAALLVNCNMAGYVTGQISTGNGKSICVPGMNCYSCPGAVGACPIGSLQAALASSKTKAPTYVIGIILLYAIMFGRWICGWLCPAGLAQELIYKIPTPKLKKNKFTRIASYLKYFILVIMVIAIPLAFALSNYSIAIPAFCKYICPVGTAEGAVLLLANPSNYDLYASLGSIFTWKFALLIGFLVASMFIYRFFCRFFCPLGALYGLFNRIAVLGIGVNEEKCNHCGACVNHCKMDVKKVGDQECILCGECKTVCAQGAITFKGEDIVSYFHSLKNKQEVEAIEAASKEEASVKVEEPKKKNVKKIVLTSVTATIMVGVLVGCAIYTSLPEAKSVYEVNETVSWSVNRLSGDSYNVSDDDKVKVLYFSNDAADTEFAKLDSYASAYSDKLTVSIVGACSIKSELEALVATSYASSKVVWAHDSSNGSALHAFTSETHYPYISVLNGENKLLLKQEGTLDEETFVSTVLPLLSGYSVGNKVGDFCLPGKIELINKESGTWSTASNIGKVVVINFWGTWCGPCVDELPTFSSVYDQYHSQGLEMIAIHQQGYDKEEVEDFIKNQPGWSDFNFHIGLDSATNEYYKALGGTKKWPMTFFIAKDGTIAKIHVNEISEEDLSSTIASLL